MIALGDVNISYQYSYSSGGKTYTPNIPSPYVLSHRQHTVNENNILEVHVS